jgi:4-hydroxy-4-methyl-2-oxoglutarate aldolase
VRLNAQAGTFLHCLSDKKYYSATTTVMNFPFTWQNDAELFSMMRRTLFTAVVGDVLDTLGFRHQFLPASIQPLSTDMVVVGRAMPVLEADFYAYRDEEGQSDLSREPFGLMFRALDDLKEHEVYVAS